MTALWCPTKSRKNKNCGPVFDEEYIKECLVNSASQICPESQASRMSGKEIWNLSWKMKSTFLAFSHWQSLTVCCIFAGAGDWTWWHRLPHSHQILQPGQSAKVFGTWEQRFESFVRRKAKTFQTSQMQNKKLILNLLSMWQFFTSTATFSSSTSDTEPDFNAPVQTYQFLTLPSGKMI